MLFIFFISLLHHHTFNLEYIPKEFYNSMFYGLYLWLSTIQVRILCFNYIDLWDIVQILLFRNSRLRFKLDQQINVVVFMTMTIIQSKR